MNYKLTVSFIGTAYNGWQRQKNGVGVQQVIEDRLSDLFGKRITLIGCCRTDAGVHALKHVSNFKVDKHKEPLEIKNFLNATLPRDISVIKVEEVDDGFNARFSSKGKTYVYLIYTKPDPFLYGRGWFFPKDFSLSLLLEAATVIKNSDKLTTLSKKGNYLREDIHLRELKVSFDGKLLQIEITASHFLRGMVRSIVGHMMAVARGSLSLKQLKEIIKEENPEKGKFMAPPEGLYLKDVYY